MFCSPVTRDEIIRILYKLPNNKAPGGDGINSKVLKVIGSSIATTGVDKGGPGSPPPISGQKNFFC